MSADSDPQNRAAQAGEQPQPEFDSRFTFILFTVLVSAFCAWALSLPLFPTQDGPMHKYYVHVLSSLLSGAHTYDVYVIRHPLPPYLTHYALLLGLSRFLSLDLAEKIFICLIFICTAYSFRYCARALGPSGDLLSLCMVPLVLHWSLVMGFLNYSLAVGLFFLAAGFWFRMAAGKACLCLPFLAVVALLSITHPVPLLLLIAACSLDLLIRVVQDRRIPSGQARPRYRLPVFALAATCLAFLYPLASADRTRTASNLHSIGFHASAFISSLVLYGVSPFDTRSRNLLVNGYRLGLYALLLGCLVLAGAGFLRRWRTGALRPGDSMLIGAVLLLLAVPVLPETMNGSSFFSQRLMIFPWLGAVAAASGFAAPRRLVRAAPVFAIALAALALLPAEILMRPVAHQLAGLEDQVIPPHVQGLALLDPAMLKAVRVEHQLGFNPYLWSGVLPFIRADDTMLNSPFMDQTITPLESAPDGDLLIHAMPSPEDAASMIDGNVDLPEIPQDLRSSLLASTKVVVYVATPADAQQGLLPLMGAAEAARYTCGAHAFYLLCVARGR